MDGNIKIGLIGLAAHVQKDGCGPETPTTPDPENPTTPTDDDGNNGHGNDPDGHDESNPAHGNGRSNDNASAAESATDLRMPTRVVPTKLLT